MVSSKMTRSGWRLVLGDVAVLADRDQGAELYKVPLAKKGQKHIDVGLIRTDAPEGTRFLVLRIRPLCHHA